MSTTYPARPFQFGVFFRVHERFKSEFVQAIRFVHIYDGKSVIKTQIKIIFSINYGLTEKRSIGITCLYNSFSCVF